MKIYRTQNEKDLIKERFLLAKSRIGEICSESRIPDPFRDFFINTGCFLKRMFDLYEEIEEKKERFGSFYKGASLEELRDQNNSLYAELNAKKYEISYADPEYSVKQLGEEHGKMLSLLYTELRTMIPLAFEQDRFFFTYRAELFLEIYFSFESFYEDLDETDENKIPDQSTIREIIYWFFSDYSEEEVEKRILDNIFPEDDFATQVIMNSDLNDLRYLYEFGEAISENEIKTAEYLNQLDTETVNKMADTFTEGFRRGFEVARKDLSKKSVVNIRYTLGYERVICRAIENFRKLGLRTTIYRASQSVFHRTSADRIGYYGAIPSKQHDYDHKDDRGLFFDRLYKNRRLEILQHVYEKYAELAGKFAGPAVMEIFGEEPFSPISKIQSIKLSEKQQKLVTEYNLKASEITNRFIKGEERSFTIIAYPTPAIGNRFSEILDEVILLNTLDSSRYEKIQDILIRALDQGEKVHVRGMNGNRTDLFVALHTLKEPQKETLFENCVADVNIPVGEVFTSPQLEGTSGILHVSKVFLGELGFEDLELEFENGFIRSYDCKNFAAYEENQNYIKENILFHHDTLPMGEFAIGTNTTAYAAAVKYDMFDKLPILIAEKTGPHFAVGDTCYSHSEDLAVYNQNGKEIIARDNSCSLNRKTDPEKAYFSCHTDITIPYEELGEISVLTYDGKEITLIRDGVFVLPGCEELNEPLKNIVKR